MQKRPIVFRDEDDDDDDDDDDDKQLGAVSPKQPLVPSGKENPGRPSRKAAEAAKKVLKAYSWNA
jgi:hypothetical protein